MYVAQAKKIAKDSQREQRCKTPMHCSLPDLFTICETALSQIFVPLEIEGSNHESAADSLIRDKKMSFTSRLSDLHLRLFTSCLGRWSCRQPAMQMPARQRPARKASWEASCSPAWYRCNSLLTIYHLWRRNPSTLGLLCHSWLHHKQWQEARCSRGCCRVGDTARCRAWHKCRNHKESSHQEKRQEGATCHGPQATCICMHFRTSKNMQPIKATVVNWLPNVATSFQRIGMHPSAHLNLFYGSRVFWLIKRLKIIPNFPIRPHLIWWGNADAPSH